MMARLGAVFFFVGVVAFFADAAWWNNNTARSDCLVLWLPIGPVTQEACLGRSMDQIVPGTHHNLVVTAEELSGRGEGPHLDDDDWAGFGSPVKTFCRRQLKSLLPPPSAPEEIKKRWPETYELDCAVLGKAPLGEVTESRRSWRPYLRPRKQNNNTCALEASTTAIVGMHRMVYETFHGPDKFPDDWMPAKNWSARLLRTCKHHKIWKDDEEGTGAVVDNVLGMTKMMGGVRTAGGKGKDDEVMRLDKYEKHSGDKLTPESVAKLLDQGPCTGRLFAPPWWSCFDATNNWVFRGCGRDQAKREDCKSRYSDEKDITGLHTVVCFDYLQVWQNGKITKMFVHVLDNHADDGPERWVDLEELDAIYSLNVDCLCGDAKTITQVLLVRSTKQSR